MQLTVHQSISIHLLKVGSVSNSSILQIGSAGNIQAQSDLYNTGEFLGPAEQALADGDDEHMIPLVPLAPP